MTPPAPAIPSVACFRRPWFWLVAAAFFLAMACLHHPATGYNVNTRLNVIFAVVDMGTFSIDAYHDTPPYDTNDKAYFEGRFYSDKVIGVSLIALPFYALLRGVMALFGAFPGFQLANWFLRVWAVSLPAALGFALSWRIMVRLGSGPRMALLFNALFQGGGMALGYATIFYPYLPGIAATLWAVDLLLTPSLSHRLSARRGLAVGLLCGFAMLCDFLFGLAVIAVGVLFLVRLLRVPDRSGWWRPLGIGAIGGLIPLSIFAVYCYHIFGTVTILYEFEYDEDFRLGMSQGFMGITEPKLTTLWFITLHPYRGLFFWTPLIAFALGGGVWMTIKGATREARLLGGCAVAVFLGYLTANAGYYMWWGGWSMGPRLMLPAYAFLPLGLVPFARWRIPHAPRWLVIAALAAGLWSVALNLPLTMLDPQVPQGNPTPYLHQVRIGDSPEIPQFFFVQGFYKLLWAGGGEHPVQWSRIASFGGFLLFLVGGHAWVWRRLRLAEPMCLAGEGIAD